MNCSLHVSEQRIGGTKLVGVEEVAFKLIVKRFFIPDREGCAWLVFDRTTGRGIGLIIGPFKPHTKAAQRMRKLQLSVGIGMVSLSLAPIVAEFGAEALRWNGTAVEACGQRERHQEHLQSSEPRSIVPRVPAPYSHRLKQRHWRKDAWEDWQHRKRRETTQEQRRKEEARDL